MVCQVNGSPHPAAKPLAIILQDKKVMSQIVPSFVNKFADNLLRFAKKADGRTVLEMDSLLPAISFDVNAFNRFIKSLAYCEEATTRNTKELMNASGLNRKSPGER